MVFRENKLLTILMALGVLAAGCGLAHRHAAEMRNRAVEIAVDYAEAAQLAGASNLTMPQTLDRLKAAGATSVAVQEPTVGDLVASGRAALRVLRRPGLPAATLVTLPSEDVDFYIIRTRLDWGGVSFGPSTVLDLRIEGEPQYALSLPVGLPAHAVRDAKAAGMPVVARLVNYPGVTASEVELAAKRLQRHGAKTIIFAADQVLGFRGGIDDVARVLKKHGLYYGSIEFARQKGDQRLAQKMLPDVIRVHSIGAQEMGTLDRGSAIDRFIKAARERNIRLVYVRMFDLSAPNALETNADYIAAIAHGLRAKGFSIRPAHPFEDPRVPTAALAFIGLGVAAGVMLAKSTVVRFPPAGKWAMFAVLAIAFAALCASGIPIALKLVALIAALAFPTLAVLSAAAGAPSEPVPKPMKAFLWPAVARFAGAIVITGAGGLMIGGLLSELPFMLRVDQFVGVKLATIFPVLAVAFAFAAGVGWGPDSLRAQWERASEALRRLGAQPVLIWQSMVAVALLVMIGLLVARSGNDAGLQVSGVELKFRSILDTVFFVRPRTKEFLVGHPALIVGLAAALGGRRSWGALLLVVGMFGEVSLLNTFCHIHTPVAVSVIRSAIGAGVGLAIGAALLLIFSRARKRSPDSARARG